jgi:hypothetical protein
MTQTTEETPVCRIEIVDQPDEIEQREKSASRFSLPFILVLSLLGIFFLFRRSRHHEAE